MTYEPHYSGSHMLKQNKFSHVNILGDYSFRSSKQTRNYLGFYMKQKEVRVAGTE